MKMNRRIDDRKCKICGSTKRVEGQTHYICDGCGSQLEELEPDPGFVPEGQTPTVLRDSGDRNHLGSRIDPTGDKASENFRKKHMAASYRKPRFIDIIVRELVKKCGTGNSSQDAARLLIEVDSKERLGAVRKKRRGTKGMGKEESKEYRARAFAAAALHILNSNGHSNTAPQVARDWGLVYLDLASAIRTLRSNITEFEGAMRERPSVLRSRQLRHELGRLRSFLHEQFDMAEVDRIIEAASRILSEEGEPLGANDQWLTGRFCNVPSPRAAFEATVTAMAGLGLPLRCARRLYERLPITGMAYFMERCSGLFAH